MKKYCILGLMALLAAACSNIDEDERFVYVKPAEAQRAVLIEDFTGQRCVNCPTATATIHDLQQQYGEDNIIAVAIHSGPFAHRSTMASAFISDLGTTEGDDYFTHWAIEAQPGVKINRGAPLYDPSQYAAVVASELQKTTTVEFSEVRFDGQEVTVIASSSERVEGKMQVWITEDSINTVGGNRNYVQLMPDGSTNIDYVHNHVYRCSLTIDPYGDPVTLEAGNKTFFKIYQLTDEKRDSSWKRENLAAVVFFWNEQDGVLQARRVPLENGGKE